MDGHGKTPLGIGCGPWAPRLAYRSFHNPVLIIEEEEKTITGSNVIYPFHSEARFVAQPKL